MTFLLTSPLLSSGMFAITSARITARASCDSLALCLISLCIFRDQTPQSIFQKVSLGSEKSTCSFNVSLIDSVASLFPASSSFSLFCCDTAYVGWDNAMVQFWWHFRIFPLLLLMCSQPYLVDIGTKRQWQNAISQNPNAKNAGPNTVFICKCQRNKTIPLRSEWHQNIHFQDSYLGTYCP